MDEKDLPEFHFKYLDGHGIERYYLVSTQSLRYYSRRDEDWLEPYKECFVARANSPVAAILVLDYGTGNEHVVQLWQVTEDFPEITDDSIDLEYRDLSEMGVLRLNVAKQDDILLEMLEPLAYEKTSQEEASWKAWLKKRIPKRLSALLENDKNTYSAIEDLLPKTLHNLLTEIMEQNKANSRQQVQLLLEVFSQATQNVREEFVSKLPAPERAAIKEAVLAAEEKGYRELIFGNKKPTLTRFNDWLSSMEGKELPKDRKKEYASAINFCKTSMKLKLMHKSEKTNEKWVVCGFEAVEKSQYTVGFRVYLTSDRKSSIYSRTAFPLLQVAS